MVNRKTNGATGRRRVDPVKTDLSLAPLVDVTFLLLVFFLVTGRMQTFDGTLPAFLARDGPGPPPGVGALPVRLCLRWDPTFERCKVYVGQVYCSDDELGVVRALDLVRQLRQVGARIAEIDAGGDVPMDRFVQTLNMLVREKTGLSPVFR